MAGYKCPACGAKMEITFLMPGASEVSPNERLSTVVGMLNQVKDELPNGSVSRAKIQASIDQLKILNH